MADAGRQSEAHEEGSEPGAQPAHHVPAGDVAAGRVAAGDGDVRAAVQSLEKTWDHFGGMLAIGIHHRQHRRLGGLPAGDDCRGQSALPLAAHRADAAGGGCG